MKWQLLAILVLAISGCASLSNTSKDEGPLVRTYHNTQHQPLRDASSSWKEETLQGAAYEAKGYRHTLSSGANSESLTEHSLALSTTAIPATDLASDSNTVSQILKDPTAFARESLSQNSPRTRISYSVYELARWERLCGKGKITVTDLRFLARVTPSGLPEHFGGDCELPKFAEPSVITAWANYCTNKDLTLDDQFIISRTANPAPCARHQ